MGKKGSTSTDAVNKGTKPSKKAKRKLSSTDAVNTVTKPLKKAKRKLEELENLETEANLKKHKQIDEERLKQPEKEEKETPECSYEPYDSDKDNFNTLLVKGFDPSLSRDATKTALIQLFSGSGKVTRVFVPIDCKTGASIGWAHVDMIPEDVRMALKLNGVWIGGRKLEVEMARDPKGPTYYPDPRGCKRCFLFLRNRSMARNHLGRSDGRFMNKCFTYPWWW